MQVNKYVCLILDVSTDTSYLSVENLATRYTLVFLLPINVVLLIVIFVLNCLTAWLIKKSRENAGRTKGSQEKTLVLRTLLVSVSNFASWCVVVPLGIMSLAGYRIKPGIVAWITLIGLPLNSLINPVLYTFSTAAFINKIAVIIGKICAAKKIKE